jgi:hypothetical protein
MLVLLKFDSDKYCGLVNIGQNEAGGKCRKVKSPVPSSPTPMKLLVLEKGSAPWNVFQDV